MTSRGIWDSSGMRIGADPVGIREASDAVTPLLVRPTADDVPQCVFCHQWLPHTPPSDTVSALECENCAEVRDALGVEPLPIATLSLYRKPSPLRDILTRYKGRDGEDDPYDPDCFTTVRAVMGRFFLERGDEFEAQLGGLDGIVVVPSTDRTPPHPLERVINDLDPRPPLLGLLERGDGDMAFRKPDKDGFRIRQQHPPARLLLVDDVYTTGSRLNSAAVALRAAGHTVAGAFVLARRINPEYTPEAARLWDATTSTPYDWSSSPWT